MNRNAGAILEQAGVYAAAFERVSAVLDDAVSSALPIRLASDLELLDELACLSRLIRLAEGERVRLAGEVARRSPASDDEGSLVKRMGATSVSALVAERAFLPKAAASAVVRLGVATRAGESIVGEPLPPERPHLAAAVEAGSLPVALAVQMLTCLTVLRKSLTAERSRQLETHLVTALDDGWTVDELSAWLKKVPETVDPDLGGPHEGDLRALAKDTEVALESGLTRFILDLNPETAGLFKTAMDAGASLKRTGLLLDGEPADPGSVSEADAAREQTDRRPRRERRVDGVRLMATRALKTDDGHVGGTAVTMLVTIPYDALTTGRGSACIDGIEATVSAATARMTAAEAELIPVVLGGRSKPLDIGESRRFFTVVQRHAMAVRDGGCAGPGCQVPVSACEAAHIRPAGYGPTSIDNGVLLCWHCHRLLDLHGWQIGRHDGRWWWTPPPHVDPLARRRPGGIPPATPPPERPFGS